MRKMRLGKTHLRIIIAAMVAAVVLGGAPAVFSEPAYAGSVPVPGELRVIGYSMETATDANYTGKVHMRDRVNVVLKVYDSRAFLANYSAAKAPIPNARLNTDSFTVPNQSDIKVVGVTQPDPTQPGWAYTLRFENLTYTGTGKTFRCEIFYEGDIAEVSPCEITIHQCVEYVPPTEPEKKEEPKPVVKGTGFVLKSASYGKDPIYAGQAFTLSTTVLATSGEHNVENVTVGITPPKELTLQDGASLVYVGSVAPGQNVPASFKLVPAANIDAGSFPINLDIKGVNAKTGEAVATQVTVSVPVLQPERFEIFSAKLPSSILVVGAEGGGAGGVGGIGGEGSIGSVTLVNRGRGTVANVSAEVVGEGVSTEEGRQYLGHVAGGEQKTAEFTLNAENVGKFDLQMLVTYENAYGEQKELTQAFSVEAEEAPTQDIGAPTDVPEEEPAAVGFPSWIWIAAGVAAAAVAVCVVRNVRKKKRFAEEFGADEDLDEEDGADESEYGYAWDMGAETGHAYEGGAAMGLDGDRPSTGLALPGAGAGDVKDGEAEGGEEGR